MSTPKHSTYSVTKCWTVVFATPSNSPFSKLSIRLPVKITYKPFVESLEQVVEVSLMKAIQAYKIACIKHLWEQENNQKNFNNQKKENFKVMKCLMPQQVTKIKTFPSHTETKKNSWNTHTCWKWTWSLQQNTKKINKRQEHAFRSFEGIKEFRGASCLWMFGN